MATRLIVNRVGEDGFRVTGAGIARSYRYEKLRPHAVSLGATEALQAWIYVRLTGEIDESTELAWDARTSVLLFRKNREEREVETLLDALASLKAGGKRSTLDDLGLEEAPPPAPCPNCRRESVGKPKACPHCGERFD